MGNFNRIMREGRVFRGKYDSLMARYKKEMDANADLAGSARYEQLKNEINARFKADATQLRLNAKKKLDSIFETCESNIDGHFKKEPTQAMVNNITLLNMRQNISPSEISIYLNLYDNCYMACQVIKEKAESLGYTVTGEYLTIDDEYHALDVIKTNVVGFIEAYNGLDDLGGPDNMVTSATMLRLAPYFQSEDAYTQYTDVKSSEEADQEFWDQIVGFGSPDILDAEGTLRKSKNTPVSYYFANIDGLLKFIDVKTQGMSDTEKVIEINNILNDCPPQYGAAYRNYRATGEKVDLMEHEDLKSLRRE